MAAQRFEVRPQTGTFGAEIAGIDLALPIGSDSAAELYATWLEYAVMIGVRVETNPLSSRFLL